MSKFDFNSVKRNLDTARKEIPLILANEAKNAFLKNFDDQGYDNHGWQEVQRRIPGTKPYMYPKEKDLGRHTRNILQGKGSGRLRKDVANSVEAGYPITDGYVGVVKNEYGGYHNDGTDILPQRQFVGFPDSLVRRLNEKAKSVWDKIWQV